VLDMDDPLAVYLHDHLAGSSFAVELLEKLVSEYGGTPSGNIARELLEQVHIDRGTLQELIAKVGKASPGLYDALNILSGAFPFKPTLRALDGDALALVHLLALAAVYGALSRVALRRF